MPPPMIRNRALRELSPNARKYSLSYILLGNYDWDFFHGIPKHFDMRMRVRLKISSSIIGVFWESFQVIFAILVAGLYVIQTYNPSFSWSSIALCALIVFVCDYLLNFYCCENRFYYVISFDGLVGAATILPELMGYFSGSTNAGIKTFPFLRLVKVLRLLRLTRLVRVICNRSISPVQKQIQTIIILLVCIVFVSAGIFHAVESDHRDVDDPPITFGDAIYFLLVTISTVGYGDIHPHTSLGKAVAAMIIIIAFTVIPTEVSRLTHLVRLQSQYRKNYIPSLGNPHILIVGSMHNPRALFAFFRELYHPDRNHDEKLHQHYYQTAVTDPPCVLLSPMDPTDEILSLLDHPILQNRVTYVKGSVMVEEDLLLAGADTARACFVFVHKTTPNRTQEDSETVLRLLAVRSYNPTIEIYTQIVSPIYYEYIYDIEVDHVLCLDHVKFGLLAKSCNAPGLVPLITNLFRSSSINCLDKMEHWEQEYIEGMALEVYATILPKEFYGITFAEACRVLYECFEGSIILIGVYDEPNRKVPAPTQANSSPVLPDIPLPPRRRASHFTNRRMDPTSLLCINPGSTLRIRKDHLVYVISENARLSLPRVISAQVQLWIASGGVMPSPAPTPRSSKRLSRSESLVNLVTSEDDVKLKLVEVPMATSVPTLVKSYSFPDKISISPISSEKAARNSRRLHPTSIPQPKFPTTYSRAASRQVVLEDAFDPLTGQELKSHYIIVSDIDTVMIATFVRLLRTSSPAPILFLSWSPVTTHELSAATRLIQVFDNVYIILAVSDSITEFLRAGVTSCRRCIILADRLPGKHLDGEALDSRAIFHYFALLSILQDYDMDPTAITAFMPMVELTIPRTMKILDTALINRTKRLESLKTNSAAFIPHLSTFRGSTITNFSLKNIHNNIPIPMIVSSIKFNPPDGKIRNLTDAVAITLGVSDDDNASEDDEGSEHDQEPVVEAIGKSKRKPLARLKKVAHDVGKRRQLHKDLATRRTQIKQAKGFEGMNLHNMHMDVSGSTMLLPFFAAGYGFSDEIFEIMLCQSFFTPGLLRLIYELLFADNGAPSTFVGANNSELSEQDSTSYSKVVVSSLVQVPVPKAFVYKTYHELFLYLLVHFDIVTLGLYRSSKSAYSLPYVVTGPSSDTMLATDDLLFVLAQPHKIEKLNEIKAPSTSSNLPTNEVRPVNHINDSSNSG